MPNHLSSKTRLAAGRGRVRRRPRPTRTPILYKGRRPGHLTLSKSRRRLRDSSAADPDGCLTDHPGAYKAVNPYSILDPDVPSPSHCDRLVVPNSCFTFRVKNPCSPSLTSENPIPPGTEHIATHPRPTEDLLPGVYQPYIRAGVKNAQDEQTQLPTPSLACKQDSSCALTSCAATSSIPTTPTEAPNVLLPGPQASGEPTFVADHASCKVPSSESRLETVEISGPLLFDDKSGDALSGCQRSDFNYDWNLDTSFGSGVTSRNPVVNKQKVSSPANERERSAPEVRALLNSKSILTPAALPQMGENLQKLCEVSQSEDARFYTDTRPYLQTTTRECYESDDRRCRVSTVKHKDPIILKPMDVVARHDKSPEYIKLKAYRPIFDRMLPPVACSQRNTLQLQSWPNSNLHSSLTGDCMENYHSLMLHEQGHPDLCDNLITNEFLERMAVRRTSRRRSLQGLQSIAPRSTEATEVTRAHNTGALNGESSKEVRSSQEKFEELWNKFEGSACPEPDVEPYQLPPPALKTTYDAQSWRTSDVTESSAIITTSVPPLKPGTYCTVHRVISPNVVGVGACPVRADEPMGKIHLMLHEQQHNGDDSHEPQSVGHAARAMVNDSGVDVEHANDTRDALQRSWGSAIFEQELYEHNGRLVPILGRAGECLGYEPTKPSFQTSRYRVSEATVLVSPTDELNTADDDEWTDWDDDDDEGEGDDWTTDNNFFNMDEDVGRDQEGEFGSDGMK